MDNAEILKLEAELQITLPNHYKLFQLNYPKELVGLGAPSCDTSWLRLKKYYKDILETNKFLECYNQSGIIKNKFCVGESGAGDYYFIDLIDKEDQKIYFIDHESSMDDHYNEETDEWNWEKLVRHLSFEDFVKHEIEHWKEFDRMRLK